MVVQIFADIVRINIADLKIKRIVSIVVRQEIGNRMRRCRIVIRGTPRTDIAPPIIEGLKTFTNIPTRHMPFATVERPITVCVEHLPNIRNFWVQMSTVERNTRFGGIQPCRPTRTRSGTHWIRTIRLAKRDTIPVKRINIRRPKIRVSVRRERIPRVLVGVNKENIGAFIHGFPLFSLSAPTSQKRSKRWQYFRGHQATNTMAKAQCHKHNNPQVEKESVPMQGNRACFWV